MDNVYHIETPRMRTFIDENKAHSPQRRCGASVPTRLVPLQPLAETSGEGEVEESKQNVRTTQTSAAREPYTRVRMQRESTGHSRAVNRRGHARSQRGIAEQ